MRTKPVCTDVLRSRPGTDEALGRWSINRRWSLSEHVFVIAGHGGRDFVANRVHFPIEFARNFAYHLRALKEITKSG